MHKVLKDLRCSIEHNGVHLEGNTVRFTNEYNNKVCTIEITLQELYALTRKIARNIPNMTPKHRKDRAILEHHAKCLTYAMDTGDNSDPVVRAYVIYLLISSTYECNSKVLEGFLSITKTGSDIYNAIHGYKLDGQSVKDHRNKTAHYRVNIKVIDGGEYLDPFHDESQLIKLNDPSDFAKRYWLACILPQIALMVYSLENPWTGWAGSVRTGKVTA